MSSNSLPPVLWQAGKRRIAESRLAEFMKHPVVRDGIAGATDYRTLHQWSCESAGAFWGALVDFVGVEFATMPTSTLGNSTDFLQTKWFEGGTLNYAYHCLRTCGQEPAIIALREGGGRREVSWDQLRQNVASISRFLISQGVKPGDRVAAIMPNVPETIFVMLAASAIGAVWSSCSPDFGVSGILDRFKQIEPRWLLVADGYIYNGKRCSSANLAESVVTGLPSLQGVLWSKVIGCATIPSFVCPRFELEAILDDTNDIDASFTPLPFDHPLVIAYSSGTTGLPKAIVHRAGGVLLQHLKEHQLQVDIKPSDRFFYFTTCGWMMWNWLVSGLASGACIVLYDGSPFADQGNVLLDLASRESIKVFGVGAKYLQSLQRNGLAPSEFRDISSVKTLLSTGSPLNEESFDYVYSHFGPDVQLVSISGGTDLLSCLVGGVPVLPVHRGLIQAAGLGMDVQVWNEAGQRVFNQRGELVCVRPFPTVPLGFWNDPTDQKFTSSYFGKYEGVWCQSDFAEEYDNGSFRIHGRSDTVLNPGGVRIGTAEIYRQVAKISTIIDSVAIGQPWQGDTRVVLFVVMRQGQQLTPEVEYRIRDTIRSGATPRHVPALILQVTDIPRTLNGKIAEKAVLSAVMGETVTNVDALANPEALLLFADVKELRDDN